jgi:hypothetical protein
MAVILTVYIIDPGDGTIKVGHEFYGQTKEEAETYFEEHIGSCEYFAAAVKEDRVLEELEHVPANELPRASDFDEDEEEE